MQREESEEHCDLYCSSFTVYPVKQGTIIVETDTEPVVNTALADADWMQSLCAVDDKSILMED